MIRTCLIRRANISNILHLVGEQIIIDEPPGCWGLLENHRVVFTFAVAHPPAHKVGTMGGAGGRAIVYLYMIQSHLTCAGYRIFGKRQMQ